MSEVLRLLDESRVKQSTAALASRVGVIALFALVFGAITAVISLILPSRYDATTTCIPVSSGGGLSKLAQFGINLDDLGLTSSGGGTAPTLFPDVVRSRRMMKQLLSLVVEDVTTHKGQPLSVYLQPEALSDPKAYEKSLRKLRSMITCGLDRRSGILFIKASASSPGLAARIANEAARNLQTYLISSFSSQAGENRRFIESRLREAEANLGAAEEKVQQFRERNLRIGNAPHLQLEQIRIERSLREQEEVYLTLRRQYEVAKVQERQDVPIINVLDEADVPVFRSFPKRVLMTSLALFVGAATGVMWVLYRSGRS